MIQFRNVVRTYGSKVAVDGLTMDVHAGEVLAFLGPNGAGKTTTIKMMVGLLFPTSGALQIAGHDIVESPRMAKRHLGYVPDQPELYDKLSGRELLRFVADLHGLKRSRADEEIERLCDLFELHGFMDELTESYSHGMRQRVAFAAALVHDPDVLILDEPTVGLDPRSMRLVKDLLRERAAEGKTVFLSTHTLAVADEIAARIGVVHCGKLLFVGTVAQLRQELAQKESSLEDLYLMLTNGDAQGNGNAP
jgi:ABC-2 type transport system ATP-binding protein